MGQMRCTHMRGKVMREQVAPHLVDIVRYTYCSLAHLFDFLLFLLLWLIAVRCWCRITSLAPGMHSKIHTKYANVTHIPCQNIRSIHILHWIESPLCLRRHSLFEYYAKIHHVRKMFRIAAPHSGNPKQVLNTSADHSRPHAFEILHFSWAEWRFRAVLFWQWCEAFGPYENG